MQDLGLTLADGLALVLLRWRARAVGASPAGRRAVAEALPPLAAGAAPQPHPGGAALRPLRPRRPAAGHCGLRKRRKVRFDDCREIGLSLTLKLKTHFVVVDITGISNVAAFMP